MVKKIALVLIYGVVLSYALIFFAPKKRLYYALEHQLQRYGVVISDEALKEHPFGLEISHAELFFKGIQSGFVKKVKFEVLLLSNEVLFEDIRISSIAKSIIPTKIKTIKLHYGVVNPLYVVAQATGEFGSASIEISLRERRVAVTLKPSPLMRQKYARTLRMMHKNNNGEYTYARSF